MPNPAPTPSSITVAAPLIVTAALPPGLGAATVTLDGRGLTCSSAVTAQAFIPADRPAVTGERQANDALTSLIAALARIGLVEDHTTP